MRRPPRGALASPSDVERRPSHQTKTRSAAAARPDAHDLGRRLEPRRRRRTRAERHDAGRRSASSRLSRRRRPPCRPPHASFTRPALQPGRPSQGSGRTDAAAPGAVRRRLRPGGRERRRDPRRLGRLRRGGSRRQPSDEIRVVAARGKLGRREDGGEQRQVRLDAEHDPLRERAPRAPDRGVAVGRPDDRAWRAAGRTRRPRRCPRSTPASTRTPGPAGLAIRRGCVPCAAGTRPGPRRRGAARSRGRAGRASRRASLRQGGALRDLELRAHEVEPSVSSVIACSTWRRVFISRK